MSERLARNTARRNEQQPRLSDRVNSRVKLAKLLSELTVSSIR
jgi:hypothetical protein